MADVMLLFRVDFSKKSGRRQFEKITVGSIFADYHAAVRYVDRLPSGGRVLSPPMQREAETWMVVEGD